MSKRVEAEIRIVRSEMHLFTYELILYGVGTKFFHVTSSDCFVEERSCDSLAREALLNFANDFDVTEGDLKWIQSK